MPNTDPVSTAGKLASSSPGAPVSPSSSDAEYDKLLVRTLTGFICPETKN